MPAPALIGIGLSAFPAPLPDRFVGDDDAPGEQPLFDVPVAQADAVVQPDTVTDNFHIPPDLVVDRWDSSVEVSQVLDFLSARYAWLSDWSKSIINKINSLQCYH
jgi:hypothetical protein